MVTALEQKVSRSRKYLEHLWWLLHHSDNPDRGTLALTSYLDDSVSDDVSSLTAIAGPVMSRHGFVAFGDEWAKMLHMHRIPNPLHMNDFVRPYGKHIGLHKEMKLALFYDVARIINRHKLYSVSISVPHVDFKTLLSEAICRELIGPYAFTFFSMVLANQSMAKAITDKIGHVEAIAYLHIVMGAHSQSNF